MFDSTLIKIFLDGTNNRIITKFNYSFKDKIYISFEKYTNIYKKPILFKINIYIYITTPTQNNT